MMTLDQFFKGRDHKMLSLGHQFEEVFFEFSRPVI